MSSPLNVLMLGWEYPPHISGGLAVACEGLTTALSKYSNIHFVLPKLLGGEQAPHMRLSDSFATTIINGQPVGREVAIAGMKKVTTAAGPEVMMSAYATPGGGASDEAWLPQLHKLMMGGEIDFGGSEEESSINPKSHYGHNVFEEVARFTARVIKRYSNADFDLIHAHDWMTYPAGVALARMSGKPLVLHVHSLDYDRSGSGRNQTVFEIERSGLHQATAVIAVSHYTKSIVNKVYEVPLSRISVVHNGIYPKQAVKHYRKAKEGSKSVLFLGRVTLQKGPDYYLQAAARVLSQLPDVTFVIAGTGDMLPAMVELAHELGIEDRIHFAGFLREREVEEAFSQADLYVMPSVSEPFGISALEAISFDTPVLMSKQSGVGEVVQHSLKFDFWDVERLADLIINGLIHEELREDMIAQAKHELVKVRWEAAAERTEQVYRSVTTASLE